MNNSLWQILSSLILVSSFAFPANAIEINTATIDAKNGCNIIVQNSGDGVQNISNLTCPNFRSFNVRYIWMNHVQTSLLLAGYSDASFEKMLGKNTNIYQNDVYRDLVTLYEKFGSRLSEGSKIYGSTSTYQISSVQSNESLLSGSFDTQISYLHPSVRSKLRFLPNEEELIWPAIKEVHDLRSLSKWPERYQAAYSSLMSSVWGSSGELLRQMDLEARRDWADLASTMSSCMRLFKFIEKSEFDNYWNDVDAIEKLMGEDAEAAKFLAAAEEINISADSVSNPLWDMIAFLTQGNWPNDFLFVTARVEDGGEDNCGGSPSGGILFQGVPRKLYVKIAVVEPLDESVVVQQINGEFDTKRMLRPEIDFGVSSWLPTGDIELRKSRGDTLILPLQIEFRYDNSSKLDLGEISGNDLLEANGDEEIHAGVLTLITKYPDREVKFNHCEPTDTHDVDGNPKWNCSIFFKSRLDNFPKPSVFNIAQSRYLFGSLMKLNKVKINGGEVDVREAPQFALYSDGIWESGSCPFLSFEMDSGDVELYGRVLIGASSSQRMRIDKIAIPKGAKRAIIREIEPEVAYLKNIEFTTSGVTTIRRTLGVKILPRQLVKLDIPDGSTHLSIEGYYRQINAENLSLKLPSKSLH